MLGVDRVVKVKAARSKPPKVGKRERMRRELESLLRDSALSTKRMRKMAKLVVQFTETELLAIQEEVSAEELGPLTLPATCRLCGSRLVNKKLASRQDETVPEEELSLVRNASGRGPRLRPRRQV
jgi:hypothetical protein